MYIEQQVILLGDDPNVTGSLAILVSDLHALKARRHAILHPKELMYFETLQYEKRQHSYLLGRFCAKQALMTHGVHTEPCKVFFSLGVFQHPFIENSSTQINWSHANNCAVALAFPENCSLGIDIEEMRCDKNLLIQSQLTVSEITLLNNIYKTEPFAQIIFWTLKEALSKALRIGFTSPLETFAICSIEKDEYGWCSDYKLFPQYRGVSFKFGKYCCSIAYPLKMRPILDISRLRHVSTHPELI